MVALLRGIPKIIDSMVDSAAAIALSKLAAGSSGLLKSDGSVITAGNKLLNGDIDDAAIELSKLANVPFCILRTANTPDQQISSSSWENIENFLDANEIQDPFDMHSSDAGGITVPDTGIYLAIGVVYYSSGNTTGSRYLGTTGFGHPGVATYTWPANAGNPQPYFLIQAGHATAGTTIALRTWQNSGVDLYLANAYQHYFMMVRLGGAAAWV